MSKFFTTFTAKDLSRIKPYEKIVRTLDSSGVYEFKLNCLPPLKVINDYSDLIIQQSRELYATEKSNLDILSSSPFDDETIPDIINNKINTKLSSQSNALLRTIWAHPEYNYAQLRKLSGYHNEKFKKLITELTEASSIKTYEMKLKPGKGRKSKFFQVTAKGLFLIDEKKLKVQGKGSYAHQLIVYIIELHLSKTGTVKTEWRGCDIFYSSKKEKLLIEAQLSDRFKHNLTRIYSDEILKTIPVQIICIDKEVFKRIEQKLNLIEHKNVSVSYLHELITL